ncbi:hypothetical protein HGRIS_012598 [Hohenbuehelia grisea]|uniref:Uncharacterized protein n=1 Tax=Hohenbuehelia grisea TaxID=104357 RepID=A0ABR3IST8_9AGAR
MATIHNSNPFRSASQTPAPTSLANVPGPDTTGSHSSARDLETNASRTATGNSPSNGQPNHESDPFGLETELPPAYTPAADPRQGEHTLEYGPVRPFQQNSPAPPRPVHPHVTSQPTGQYLSSTPSGSSYSQGYPGPGAAPQPRSRGLLSTLAGELERQLTVAARQLTTPSTYHQPSYNRQSPIQPAPTGGTWSSYPGRQRQQQYGPTLTPNPTGYAPPPSHPQVQHARSTSSPITTSPSSPNPTSTPTSSSAASDFARDFYAAGAGPDNVALTDENEAGNRAAVSPSPGPPPPLPDRQPVYAPPPGPPPRPRSASPTRSSSFLSPPGNTGGVPDDGRPTHTPTPGHPLLRDGKLLVYPNGHECDKCKNTGYKHGDPMNPCKKCWQKYAKPYAGALAAAPWGSSANQPPASHSALDLRRQVSPTSLAKKSQANDAASLP